MRRLLISSLAAGMALAALAAPAGAVLKKYALQRTFITQSPHFSPNPDRLPPCSGYDRYGRLETDTCEGKAVVDATESAPVLRRFEFATDGTATVIVPDLVTTVFLSIREREGPTASATGSGSTAAGTSLRWGSVTGWTISGANWCNSNPPVLCSLAERMDEETTDPRLPSSFYDLGTWSFHGTGFTSVPFVVHRYGASDDGNTSVVYSGALSNDGTVPALPALGVLALAGLLAGGAASALRRDRTRAR